MPRLQNQVSQRAQRQRRDADTAPARPVRTIVDGFSRLLDAEQAHAFALAVTEAEFKALVDWAYERHETQKEAEKDYKAARLLIKERASAMGEVSPEGETVDASFSPRSAKVTDAWKVWLRLKARTLWVDGKKETRRSIFNKCFKVTGEAAEVLGQDVIDACTDVVVDDFAMLKLKRR